VLTATLVTFFGIQKLIYFYSSGRYESTCWNKNL